MESGVDWLKNKLKHLFEQDQKFYEELFSQAKDIENRWITGKAKYKIPKLIVKTNGRIYLTKYFVEKFDVPSHSFASIVLKNNSLYFEVGEGKVCSRTKNNEIRFCCVKTRRKLDELFNGKEDYDFIADSDANGSSKLTKI